jgi:hypothetical protein
MKIPQFTAESSLGGRSDRSRPRVFDRALLQETLVIPQLPQKNAPGMDGCIGDCVDLHPDWKAGLCGKVCRASTHSFRGNPQTSRGIWGSLETFITNFGIDSWEAVCAADTSFTGVGPVGCHLIGNEVRRQS